MSDENSDEGRVIDYIELAEELRDRVQIDITDIYYNEKMEKIDDLVSFSRLDWISKRPAELVNFLSGLCSIDLNNAHEKKLNLICKTIELIYYCRNSKLELPEHFIENLVSYTCSNSKINCNFQGSLSPGGSYSSLSLWLKQQACEPIAFPKGMVKNVFDNNQKVGKTYIITGDNKVPTTVMTSHLWITLDKNSTKQNDVIYKPQSWMWPYATIQTTEELLFNKMIQPSQNFRETRDSFVTDCISLILK